MRIAPISAGEVIAPNCALIMPTAALVSTYTSGSLSNSFVSPTSGGLRCRFFRGGVLSISAITGSYQVKYEEGASNKWSFAASANGALRNCSYAAIAADHLGAASAWYGPGKPINYADIMP